MPNTEIELSHNLVLIPQPPGAGTQPVDKAAALRMLQTARGNALVMRKLRALFPVPVADRSDDEIFEALAAKVAMGQMTLRRRGTCSADKQRFFDWLAESLTAMAKDLDTTKQIMLTLAVKEGGWNKIALDHNQPLQNPFGVNYIVDRKAAGNKKYTSLQDAINEWKQNHSYVQGVKDPQAFVNALLAHHYNTVNPNYGGEFMDRYADVGRAMISCSVQP